MTPTREANQVAQILAGKLKDDGFIGPKSKARFREVLGITDLPKHRLVAGIIQKKSQGPGIPPGIPELELDFWYGPATDYAVEAWMDFFENRDQDPREDEVKPGGWKAPWKPAPKCYKPTDRQMIKRYGEPGTGQETFTIPYPVRLAWNPDEIVTRITMHYSLVERTISALENIAQSYPESERAALGLNLYGGALNVRKKRGGTTWSAHAFGAAIDWDPDHNRLRWGSDRARFAGSEYDRWWAIWENHGFTNLGRCFDFDWMHVQANP